jgi:hypothetical protein
VPWLIAIAEHKEAARVALAAKRALEKDPRRLDTLVERLEKDHGIESYFPLTRKRVKNHRGRSEPRIRNYLDQYFFVKLKRSWFDKRNIPTYVDERGKHELPYFFLELTDDYWLEDVLRIRGIVDVCSTLDTNDQLQPLLMSDAELRFKVKSHEVDGFIPDERKRKRGENMRVTDGLLKGRVGIFETDLRRGKAAALVIDGKRVVLPEQFFDPIDISTHKTGAIPSGY